MDPLNGLQPQFLTRKMLDFEHAVSFGLKIWSQCTSDNVIQIRGFTKEGPFQFTHTTDSSADTKTETFRLPDIPIFVSAHSKSNTLRHGSVFIRGMLTINGDDIMGLFSGYVSAEQAPSWPSTFNSVVRPGAGRMEIVESTDPAAGAEASINFGSNYMTLVHAAQITLVTDATVADRLVKLRVTQNAGMTMTTKALSVTQASQTKVHSFLQTSPFNDLTSTNYIMGIMPTNFWVEQLGNISSLTDNIQAADNLGPLRILVEKFFDRGTF